MPANKQPGAAHQNAKSQTGGSHEKGVHTEHGTGHHAASDHSHPDKVNTETKQGHPAPDPARRNQPSPKNASVPNMAPEAD